jgi:hypothetical protein
MPYGPGTANPLLNADGSNRLSTPGLAVRLARTLADIAFPAATTGPQRHTPPADTTRGPGTKMVRRVRITMPRAPQWALEMVSDLDQHTGGGAGLTQWREPEFDTPGPAETAPRWRLLTEPTVTRARGGIGVDIEFELEEV